MRRHSLDQTRAESARRCIDNCVAFVVESALGGVDNGEVEE
jgi:hypothetical protein